MQKYKKWQNQLWTVNNYVLSPTYHIARKFNLLLHIPYKGTTYKIIEKNPYKFYTEVTEH